jgi:hypothetical protein
VVVVIVHVLIESDHFILHLGNSLGDFSPKDKSLFEIQLNFSVCVLSDLDLLKMDANVLVQNQLACC